MDLDRLLDYKSHGIPVLMKGMIKDYPAINKWTLEFFKKEYGDEDITVHWGNVEQSSTRIQEMYIADFIDKLKNYTKDPSLFAGDFPYWAEDDIFFYE